METHTVYKKILWGACIITSAAVFELIGYFLSGSLMVRSDAYHGFIDAIPLWVSVITLRFMNTSKQRQRVELGLGFFGALLIAGMTIDAIRDALGRLQGSVTLSMMSAGISATVGLCANIATANLLRKHRSHSHLIHASYIHNMSDMALSVAALAGLALGALFRLTFGGGDGMIDAVLTMGAGAYLLFLAGKLFWDTLCHSKKILWEKHTQGLDHIQKEIKARLSGISGAVGYCFHLPEKEVHVIIQPRTSMIDQIAIHKMKNIFSKYELKDFRICIERTTKPCGSCCTTPCS